MKTCSKCKKVKSIDEFWKDKRSSSGYSYQCAQCKKEYYIKNRSKFINRKKAYYFKNKEKILKKHKEWHKQYYSKNKDKLKRKLQQTRLKKYGINIEQFNIMLDKQGYQCLICNKQEELVVDHDHVTGKVRGLLCNKCNAGLGMFLDNPDLLQKAQEYLHLNLGALTQT